MRLHELTEIECERYRKDCNFTASERAVFDLLVRGRSRTEIALSLAMSTATADRRIRGIKNKIMRVSEPGN